MSHSPLTRQPQSKTMTQAQAITHCKCWRSDGSPQYTRADHGRGAVSGSYTTTMSTAQIYDEPTTKLSQQGCGASVGPGREHSASVCNSVGTCVTDMTPEHYFCCAQCNIVTLGRRLPLQPSAVGNRSLMWPCHITGTPGCSTPKVDNQHSLG